MPPETTERNWSNWRRSRRYGVCLASFAGLHLDLHVSHSRGEKSGWQRSGNEARARPHKSLSAEVVNYVIAKVITIKLFMTL